MLCCIQHTSSRFSSGRPIKILISARSINEEVVMNFEKQYKFFEFQKVTTSFPDL